MSKPRSFDHDHALSLWRLGFRRRVIAERVHGKPATVTSMIRDARNRGDARAVRRYLTQLPMPSGSREKMNREGGNGAD